MKSVFVIHKSNYTFRSRSKSTASPSFGRLLSLLTAGCVLTKTGCAVPTNLLIYFLDSCPSPVMHAWSVAQRTKLTPRQSGRTDRLLATLARGHCPLAVCSARTACRPSPCRMGRLSSGPSRGDVIFFGLASGRRVLSLGGGRAFLELTFVPGRTGEFDVVGNLLTMRHPALVGTLRGSVTNEQ